MTHIVSEGEKMGMQWAVQVYNYEVLFILTDMEFIEALTEGLPRVLLVRGTGSEVVTIYS
jgi:hypothetical protein